MAVHYFLQVTLGFCCAGLIQLQKSSLHKSDWPHIFRQPLIPFNISHLTTSDVLIMKLDYLNCLLVNTDMNSQADEIICLVQEAVNSVMHETESVSIHETN